MCESEIVDINSDLEYSIKILEYLKDDDSKNLIIQYGIDYLIQNPSNNEFLENFQESLFRASINLHFSWIIDHCLSAGDDNIKFRGYSKLDINSRQTYCSFYQKIIDYSNDKKNIKKSKKFRKFLKSYFKIIKKKYC